jgi:hypothetical protein
MESLLIGVTVISLLLAVTMTAIAWSLWQAERERSAARAEALEALAFSEVVEPRAIAPLPSRIPSRPAATPRAQTPAPLATADNIVPFDETSGDDDWDYALRGTRMDDGDLADHSAGTRRTPAGPDQMFHTERATGVGGRLWLALAAVTLVVTAGVVSYRAFHSPEIRAVVSASRGPAARTPDTAADNVAGTHALELLSLRYSISPDGAFTVTGLVQNPVDGDTMGEVDAVLYLFDDQGLYFAGGKAPLEVPDIAPGDESPFTIKVAATSGVSRYRVGFRRADGRVLAHIDRRGQLPDGTSGDAIDARPALATPAGAIRRAEGAIVR